MTIVRDAPAPALRPALGVTARRARWVRSGAEVLLAAALTLVTYWWATGGGVTDLGGWATGLTSVGRLTGLLASVLLLAQVLLMARVPLLEHAFGQDRLARVHRLVGFTSFDLMLAHVVTDHLGLRRRRPRSRRPATLWDLTVDYPGMLLAVAGTACLVHGRRHQRQGRTARGCATSRGTCCTSTPTSASASPCRTSCGPGRSSSPRPAAHRVLVGAVGRGRRRRAGLAGRRCRCGAACATGSGHLGRAARAPASCRSTSPAGAWTGCRAEAGQFFSWRFLDRPGLDPRQPLLALRRPGRPQPADHRQGARRRQRRRRAGCAPARGCWSRARTAGSAPRARTRPRVALIGAGVGITPLRALAEGLTTRPATRCCSSATRTQPLFAAELDVLARERGLQVLAAARPPPRARAPGSATAPAPADDLAALRTWVPDIAERDVFVCGPAPWRRLVAPTLAAAGVPADRVHTESFGW